MKKNHYKKYYGYYKKNKRDLLICGILALLTLVIVYKMHFIIAIHDNRGFYTSLMEFIGSCIIFLRLLILFVFKIIQ